MSQKNIDKVYGIDIAIREMVDAEILESYLPFLQRLLHFVDFDSSKYYIYVHHITIYETYRRRYFAKDLALAERIQSITLEYKVNKKQLNNMRFYNEYADFRLVDGVVQIPTESKIQFIFAPHHIIDGRVETKLVTFIERRFIRNRHMKIKLDIHVHPTDLMEKRLENNNADLITAIDIFFTKELKFSIPEFLRQAKKIIIPSPGSDFKTVQDFILEKQQTIIEILNNNWSISKKKIQGEYELKMIAVGHWLGNFLPQELDMALDIMKAITYFSGKDIEDFIETLSKELLKIFSRDISKVYFMGLGESPGSSGSSLLFLLRKALGATERQFPGSLKDLSDDPGLNVVFIDDIIGSGKQACTYYQQNLASLNCVFYYISIIGFQKGIEYIRENTGFEKVFSAQVYNEHHKAFSDNSIVFQNKNYREKLKDFAYAYGSRLYPKGPLGFDDSQALVVFDHNVPNNTLPIIWASPDNEKVEGIPWSPLWKRRKII